MDITELESLLQTLSQATNRTVTLQFRSLSVLEEIGGERARWSVVAMGQTYEHDNLVIALSKAARGVEEVFAAEHDEFQTRAKTYEKNVEVMRNLTVKLAGRNK